MKVRLKLGIRRKHRPFAKRTDVRMQGVDATLTRGMEVLDCAFQMIIKNHPEVGFDRWLAKF